MPDANHELSGCYEGTRLSGSAENEYNGKHICYNLHVLPSSKSRATLVADSRPTDRTDPHAIFFMSLLLAQNQSKGSLHAGFA
jgi:hypothetical protein